MAIKILRFISLAIGLGIIGLAFGVIGALIGGRVLGDDTFGALGLAVLGFFAGNILGMFIGLILIKKLLHQRGSLFFGILGGVIGIIIPWIIALSWNQSPSIFLYLPIVCGPVLCLAGFYLKR